MLPVAIIEVGIKVKFNLNSFKNKDFISRRCWLCPVPLFFTSLSEIHWSLCFRAFLCPLSIVIAMERYVHFWLLRNTKTTEKVNEAEIAAPPG